MRGHRRRSRPFGETGATRPGTRPPRCETFPGIPPDPIERARRSHPPLRRDVRRASDRSVGGPCARHDRSPVHVCRRLACPTVSIYSIITRPEAVQCVTIMHELSRNERRDPVSRRAAAHSASLSPFPCFPHAMISVRGRPRLNDSCLEGGPSLWPRRSSVDVRQHSIPALTSRVCCSTRSRMSMKGPASTAVRAPVRAKRPGSDRDTR